MPFASASASAARLTSSWSRRLSASSSSSFSQAVRTLILRRLSWPPPIAFDLFIKGLNGLVDSRRLGRAIEMLKAERFQLYSEVEERCLYGVVASQTEEGLVYSCRLEAGGKFGCCSHNLHPCLGMRGALCKHLMVLIVGLTRARKAEAALVLEWVKAEDLERMESYVDYGDRDSAPSEESFDIF